MVKGKKKAKKVLKRYFHNKDVTTIDLEKANALDAEDPATKKTWLELSRWLWDPTRYAGLPGLANMPPPPPTRMRAEYVEAMERTNKTEKLASGDRPRSLVDVFSVSEIRNDALRERAIEHPWIINGHFGKWSVDPVSLPGQADKERQAKRGKFCICLDFSSWYDQFGLAEAVRNFFCYRYKGGWYRLTRLPMGLRHSVSIACALTNLLLSFPHAGVETQMCIDNIRFVSDDREQLLQAVRTFVERCKKIGAQLNENTDDLESLVVSKGEWLGAEYDYKAKRTRLTSKVLDKLLFMWQYEEEWTNRSFGTVMGILLYATTILEAPDAVRTCVDGLKKRSRTNGGSYASRRRSMIASFSSTPLTMAGGQSLSTSVLAQS